MSEPTFEPFAQLRDVPVNVTELHRSAESARTTPRGDVVLGFDRRHGLVRNVVFDAARLVYDADYENSQAFSPAFRSYQDELARRLVATYALQGGDIVEIGSGKGEFLTAITAIAGARGYGFDPSYAGQADDAGGAVTFVVEPYDRRHVDQPADLVACRHVLEHLEEPELLLAELRSVLDGRRDTIVYFEVPNLDDILAGGGMWDVIYQHVWYFSSVSLRWLFESHGFEVLDVRTPFEGAFLSLEARAGEPQVTDPGPDLELLAARVEGFGQRLETCQRHWALEFERARSTGERIALWGAGAKGVTFLNAVEGGDQVATVIDLNPRKQGSFVPGTGQVISGPEAAVDAGIDRVVLLNPNYRDEVADVLRELGSSAAVEVV